MFDLSILQWVLWVILPIVLHMMLSVAYSKCEEASAHGSGSLYKCQSIFTTARNLSNIHIVFWLLISMYFLFIVDFVIAVLYFLIGWRLGCMFEESGHCKRISHALLKFHIPIAITLGLLLLLNSYLYLSSLLM